MGDLRGEVVIVKQLIFKIKAGTITLEEFVDRMTDLYSKLPTICEECRKARFN